MLFYVCVRDVDASDEFDTDLEDGEDNDVGDKKTEDRKAPNELFMEVGILAVLDIVSENAAQLSEHVYQMLSHDITNLHSKSTKKYMNRFS